MRAAKSASAVALKGEESVRETPRPEEPIYSRYTYTTPVLFSFSAEEVAKETPDVRELSLSLQKGIPYTFGRCGSVV